MHRTPAVEIGIEERRGLMAHRLLIFALGLITVTSGCVIPVAPKFDDPEPNFPPFYVESNPGVGSILTFQGMSGDAREIAVTIADQNLGDHLFTKWIFDYPPYDDRSRVVLFNEYNPTGEVVRGTLRIQPSCSQKIAGGSSQHRLVLSISDREFLNADNGDIVAPEARLDSVPEGAQNIRLFWLINLECQ
jgi:hypothetical protein